MTKLMNRTETKVHTITTILDFMNTTYFNLERSFHDTDRRMYCFVFDIKKMGNISDEQREQIYETMWMFTSDKIMLGNSTLLFEMEDSNGFNPAKEVNICVYDLDFNEVTDRYMRWDKNHPCINPKYADQNDELRKQIYTEWERIGKTLKSY